jgi:hypothetical protein
MRCERTVYAPLLPILKDVREGSTRLRMSGPTCSTVRLPCGTVPSLREEVRGCLLSTVGRKEEVHDLRHLIRDAIQIRPRSVERDVGFVQAPADP